MFKCYFCTSISLCYSCSKAKEAYEIGIKHGTYNQTLMSAFPYQYLQSAYEVGYNLGASNAKHNRNKR